MKGNKGRHKYKGVLTDSAQQIMETSSGSDEADETALLKIKQRTYSPRANDDGEQHTPVLLAKPSYPWYHLLLPVRMWIGILGFAMELVCYADRTNISLAIVEMSAQFSYDESTQGWILSGFFIGYLCTQILGGWAAAIVGGKPVLAFGVFFWSLCTLLTPPAAFHSLPALITVRIMMGLGEGVSLPTMHHLTAMWVPVGERSRFITLCTSGQFAGTMVAMVCAPMVQRKWQSVFYLFGFGGFGWNLWWHFAAASTPESHPGITPHELAYIVSHRSGGGSGSGNKERSEGGQSSGALSAPPALARQMPGGDTGGNSNCNRAQSEDGAPGIDKNHRDGRSSSSSSSSSSSLCGACALKCVQTPWAKFLAEPAFVAVMTAHFAHNWGWYLLLSWLPKYMVQELHLDVGKSGIVLLVPYLVPFLMSNFSGHISDWLIQRGAHAHAQTHAAEGEGGGERGPEGEEEAAAVSNPMAQEKLESDHNLDSSSSGSRGRNSNSGGGGGDGGGGSDRYRSTNAGRTVASTRKLMQTIAFVGPITCLTLIILIKQPSVTVATTLMAGALGLGAFSHSGFWANAIDIGPSYAGTLLGISNTVATFPGILANISTGYILQHTDSDWNIVFMLAIAIYAIGLVVFLCYARGDIMFK